MKSRSIAEVVALIVWLSVGAAFRTAEGRVWHVHPGPNAIQSGLDSCANGDTVLVAKGTYHENLNWPNTLGIVLRSDSGPDCTEIDGDAVGSVIAITTTLSLNTVICGFTITNGGASLGAGICCSNCSPTIQNNVITNNRATSAGGGIYCRDASPTVRDNVISWNSAGSGSGIYCSSSSPTIVDNTIERNEGASEGGAVFCNSASSPLIDSNRILSNAAARGAGVFCDNGSRPTVYYNNIVGNTYYGVYNAWPYDTVDARFNWWGDSTGPWHPTLNPNGRGDWVSDKVKFDPWLAHLGIDESAVLVPPGVCDFAVYPNPARQSLTISLPAGVRRSVVTICGASGRLVRALHPEGKRLLAVSTSGLPPGVYFVSVTSYGRGRSQSKKVVISK